MNKCPKCGSEHVQEHGKNAGDHNWFLCIDCSHVWDAEITIKESDMLRYLQSMLDDYMKHCERYGADDRISHHKLDAMIACKEMVEVFLRKPVNLQKDGKVTTGF